MTKYKSNKIAVLDYGMGNIGSILNMLHHIGVKADVATEPEHIDNANKIILPGVGHFDRAMKNLIMSGMADALKHAVINRGLPILGICLGMQLMCKSSEEGLIEGLGFLNAHARKIKVDNFGLKVPHMGWNKVSIRRNGTILGDLNEFSSRYYFVHSYCVSCEDPEDIIGVTNYGIKFVSAFQHKSIIGVQFHPEKSHRYGMQLLNNFINSTS